MSDDTDPKPASFSGRLQLRDFMHVEEPSPVRRSPRNMSTTTAMTPPLPRPSPSPSPSKRKSPSVPSTNTSSKRSRPSSSRKSSSYAPPSTYAHLPPLPDAVAPNMLIYFVGLNPGLQTAATGHAYAHPSNLFWKLLHSSGITPDRLVPATEDRELPARYACGFTNIVSRPSRNGAELSRAEMDAGVAALEAKAARWRPEVMCIVGKSIWESIFRVRRGRGLRKGEFAYGWQDEAENMGVGVDPAAVEALGTGPGPEVDEEVPWAGARVFVASSTSGLAATLSPAEKEKIWNELGSWCQERREERAQSEAAL
ncbi:G/U mismatch-specific uracil DNA glycosylase [Plectosphaerella plurivora]|uniref:G/U mismatch-specific uracil DNA glycosylase n=1 Tax=Plectosphaerella plurivora TaxID=936078 RepID=A0A9P8VH05_9PEZI|nr:G/U mismatch-specific uracil DNA glycosylase [Plectosphaerella plurivora]